MKFLLSPLGKVLYDNLNNPNDWDISNYNITHWETGSLLKKTKIALWIGNGAFFFDKSDTKEGPPFSLGLLERHILYRKYKRMLKSQNDNVIDLFKQ